MLKTLTGEQIEDTAEHLATRVQHRSPNVKLKALRCVKWLCQRGNEPRFRRAMTKRSGPVRTCVSHTGRPDPQRGDAPHKAVRDMAKETLEVMFANDANGGSGGGGGGGGRMEGFGSDAAARTGAPYASHDVSFDGNEQLGSWGGVAEPTNGFGGDEATAIIGDGPARLNKISGTWGAPEPPRAPPPAPTPSPPPAAAAAADPSPAPAQAPALRLASRDIWGQPAQQPAQQSAQPAQPPSPPLSPVAAGANAPFTLDGSEEQRRVDALCAGGGVKLAPAGDAMDAFAAACGGLRPEGVARALAHKIRGGEWREGYRAACVLEHVAKAGGASGGGCEAVVRAFASAEADALDAAATDAGSHERLRAKAAEAKAAVAARVGGVANRSTNAPAASNAPVAAGEGVNLFGLMGDGTTPAAATATATSSFDAFAVAPPPPTAPPAVPAAFAPPPDLLGGFEGISLGGGGAPAPASAPPAPAPGVDPFGGLPGGVSSPPPAVVQTGGAMFGGLDPSMMTAKPSSSRSPTSPTALNGKQSTYQQHKDAKAFDFVSDMLKKK